MANVNAIVNQYNTMVNVYNALALLSKIYKANSASHVLSNTISNVQLAIVQLAYHAMATCKLII